MALYSKDKQPKSFLSL